MKKSADIQNLPIFSLIDGAEIGSVKQLVINPAEGNVEIFLVENEQDAIGIHILPYTSVIGVGDFAVTVESADAIQEVALVANARELVLRGYKIIGTRVLSRKGQLLGAVDEYYVDPDTGIVTACSFLTNDTQSQRMFDRDNILTFGRDVIVIKQEELIFTSLEERNAQAQAPQPSTSEAEVINLIAAAELEAAAARITSLEKAKEGPYAYLIGKHLSADLTADDGTLVASANTEVTADLIERVQGISPTLFMKLNRLAVDPS